MRQGFLEVTVDGFSQFHFGFGDDVVGDANVNVDGGLRAGQPRLNCRHLRMGTGIGTGIGTGMGTGMGTRMGTGMGTGMGTSTLTGDCVPDNQD